MDEFIFSFSELSTTLIPILGAVALVVLIVLLVALISLIKSIQKTTDSLPSTIGLVDKSIEKVQAPLDTAVKVSKTVDKVHDDTVEVVEKAKDYVVNNVDIIKNKLASLSNDNDKKQIDNTESKGE